jgi:hypothetical protein
MIDGLVMCSPEIVANARADRVTTREFRNGRWRASSAMVGDMWATRAELRAVAFVDNTANLTSTKVRAWAGDYRDACDRARWHGQKPAIIDRAIRAAGYDLRSKRPAHVKIMRPTDSSEHRGSGRRELDWSAPSAGYVLAVR